jgi:hypothetical protein
VAEPHEFSLNTFRCNTFGKLISEMTNFQTRWYVDTVSSPRLMLGSRTHPIRQQQNDFQSFLSLATRSGLLRSSKPDYEPSSGLGVYTEAALQAMGGEGLASLFEKQDLHLILAQGQECGFNLDTLTRLGVDCDLMWQFEGECMILQCSTRAQRMQKTDTFHPGTTVRPGICAVTRFEACSPFPVVMSDDWM